MKTLLLDTQAWDLVLDANRNIALADAPYALAQDVASAILNFKGENWFDTSIGVLNFQILGQFPALSFVRSQYEAAALTVPGVVKAKAIFTSFKDRVLSGQVLITDASGNTQGVPF